MTSPPFDVLVNDRDRTRRVPGPADLNSVGVGATVIVRGEPEREHQAARWAGPIGSAVLRGASVRRLP